MTLFMSCLPNIDLTSSFSKNFAKDSNQLPKLVPSIGPHQNTHEVAHHLSYHRLFSYSSPKFCRKRVHQHAIAMQTTSNSFSRQETKSSKIYKRLHSCLVLPPPNGEKPSAIVMFLGGAFIGAIPEITYSLLINLLANEGFVIICVPYNVTFYHSQTAAEVHEKFNSCLDKLLTSGIPDTNISSSDLVNLPVYSVGHSNGALLQMLAGSYFSENIPKANAVISYNNRPASEAVPYFEQLGPAVNQLKPMVESFPMYSVATGTAGDALTGMLEVAKERIQEYDPEFVVSMNNFVYQLPLVTNQIAQGISEFKPKPSENRDLLGKSYNVKHTLLVKFIFDTIDETDTIEEILKFRVESIGGRIEKISLRGTHLTPCIQDLQWRVGGLYTPADAIAQGLKSLSIYDTKVLARTLSNWFKSV